MPTPGLPVRGKSHGIRPSSKRVGLWRSRGIAVRPISGFRIQSGIHRRRRRVLRLPRYSAAVAAAAANPPHNIFVAANKTYTAEKITINNLDLAITGGFTSCADSLAPSGNTTISGAGNGTHSVIAIGGASNVEISNLTITHGLLGSGQTGGGIYFGGSGTLTITSSTISDNTADFGAGIEVNGFDVNNVANVIINGPDTFITGNTAQNSGGGIRIEGNAALSMFNDGIFVGQNTASGGNGGGNCLSSVLVGLDRLPGTGTGVIYDNMAVNGGGIAVEPSHDTLDQSFLYLFSTDPDPTRAYFKQRCQSKRRRHLRGRVRILEPRGEPRMGAWLPARIASTEMSRGKDQPSTWIPTPVYWPSPPAAVFLAIPTAGQTPPVVGALHPRCGLPLDRRQPDDRHQQQQSTHRGRGSIRPALESAYRRSNGGAREHRWLRDTPTWR